MNDVMNPAPRVPLPVFPTEIAPYQVLNGGSGYHEKLDCVNSCHAEIGTELSRGLLELNHADLADGRESRGTEDAHASEKSAKWILSGTAVLGGEMLADQFDDNHAQR